MLHFPVKSMSLNIVLDHYYYHISVQKVKKAEADNR